MSTATKPILVLITGLSGAGKSTVIHTLEDIGFYCIDNLPSRLIGPTLDLLAETSSKRKQFAFGMDVRDADFVTGFPEIIKHIKKSIDVTLDILFLTADDDTLINRFTATRRKHPLLDMSGELLASVRRERELLRNVEKQANSGFDTTSWSPHQLARMIEQRYESVAPNRHLHVTITSFGFKYGPLRNADVVYDVRFLPNPHFHADLKPLSGQDQRVHDYVFAQRTSQEYFEKLADFQAFLLPHYYQEGKHYLRIGIGCTGGRHRSVCIAEKLGREISDRCLEHMLVSVHHRDLEMHATSS